MNITLIDLLSNEFPEISFVQWGGAIFADCDCCHHGLFHIIDNEIKISGRQPMTFPHRIRLIN